jgi:hypothetical protein
MSTVQSFPDLHIYTRTCQDDALKEKIWGREVGLRRSCH